jgi:hypothetical protein
MRLEHLPVGERDVVAEELQAAGRVCSDELVQQNLGHEELMTTFASYGNLGRSQQADIMTTLATQMDAAPPQVLR